MSDDPETRTAPSDAYEATFAKGEGTVLHRDKHVARTAALAMIPMALLLLVATIAIGTGSNPGEPRALAILPALGLAWTVFVGLTGMVVRSVLTRETLEVHWGFRRKVIPLGAITVCEAKAAAGGPTAATGAGWALVASKGSVLVEYRDGAKTQKLLVPANDPGTLAAQVNAAREALQATGVRVEGGRSEGAGEAESGHVEAGRQDDVSRRRGA